MDGNDRSEEGFTLTVDMGFILSSATVCVSTLSMQEIILPMSCDLVLNHLSHLSMFFFYLLPFF